MRIAPLFTTQELQRYYPSVRQDSEGKLGCVYSYFNYAKRRRVYVHVLSPEAAQHNEQLALDRTRRWKRDPL